MPKGTIRNPKTAGTFRRRIASGAVSAKNVVESDRVLPMQHVLDYNNTEAARKKRKAGALKSYGVK